MEALMAQIASDSKEAIKGSKIGRDPANHLEPSPVKEEPSLERHGKSVAAQALAMKSFLEKLNSNYALNPPPQVELRASQVREPTRDVLGVWAVEKIVAGTKYGPFLGKWAMEVDNPDFAWEVLVPSAGVRGFLDASDYGSWLKHIQCSAEAKPEQQNVTQIMIEGQIYYQTLIDICPGEEMALGPNKCITLDQNETSPNFENMPGESSASASSSLNNHSKHEDSISEDISNHDKEDRLPSDEDDDNDDNGVKCIKCEKLFPDITILDHHMVEAHSHTPNQYRCEHCSESFAWRPNLLRHKMIHGEFRRFPCENCDKVFTDPSNLQRHIRTNHVGARSHACPECGKTFATSSGLKQHTHIHSSVKPFRCEVCFKSYTQFSNLCRHKRMHANCRMQIKCHKCGQAFSTVTSLSKHRRFCDSTPSPYLALAHHGGANSTSNSSPQPHSSPTIGSTASLAKMGLEVGGDFHTSSVANFGKSSSDRGPLTSHPHHTTAGATSSPSSLGLNAASVNPLGAMAQAAAANLLSPYAAAHFLQQKQHQQQQSANALAALAMAGVPNNPFASFLQNSPLLLPNMLHRLANQHQLLGQSGFAASAASTGFSNGTTTSASSPRLSSGDNERPPSMSPPCLGNKRKSPEKIAIIERPWLDNKRAHLEERSAPSGLSITDHCTELRDTKAKSHLYDGGKSDGDDDDQDRSQVDVNRNVSHEDKKDAEGGRGEDRGSSIRGLISEPVLDLSSSGKGEHRTRSSKKIRKLAFSEDEAEEEDEDVDYDRNSDLDAESEPKGFQPVRRGSKAFVPVKDKVGVIYPTPKREGNPQDSPRRQAGVQEAQYRHSTPPPPLAGSLPFAHKGFPASGTSTGYPRHFHPLLFEAVYRMHHHRPSAGTSSPVPGIHSALADHSGLNGIGSSPARFPYFPSSSMMLHGGPANGSSLDERSFFSSRNYPDLISGIGGIKTNKDRYSCKFCGKVFPRSANLTRHLRTHTGEQPYKCKYCERSFSISSNLQRHVRNIHNKEKPFKCPLCDRSFGQQTNLDRHLKKHENCSDPSAIVDSPEGPRGAEEEGYFDEIRSFMGKVTADQHPLSEYSPRHSEPDIDVEDEEDEDMGLEQD